MSRSKRVTVTPEEEATLIERVNAKLRPEVLITASKCDACPKILEENEIDIRGYASGRQLGLCRRCSSFVNTEQAINQAIREGHMVNEGALIVVPERKEKDHAPV